MKYKVSYSGFYYVVADSPEDAEQKIVDDKAVYNELVIESITEVEDFLIEVG